MLKKILPLLIICVFLVAVPVFAQYTPVTPTDIEAIDTGGSTTLQEASQLGARNPVDTASLIINWILTIMGLFFLILMIYGGFIWMLARGNESEVEKATNIIKAAVIGLIIILLSYGISAFIFTVVTNISQT